MRQARSWRSLRVGLATLAAIVAALLSVLLFAHVGALHGRTMRLFVTTNNATGLIRGADVWLSGERIGTVQGTSLRPVTVDTAQRVLVRIEIPKALAPQIRRDTRAQVRPGSSMLGAPVVYLSGGTAQAPPLKAGDTIVAQPQSALDETRATMALAGAQVPALRADVESLTTQLFSRSGTIGAVSTRSEEDQRVTVLDALTTDLKRRTKSARPAIHLDSARAALVARGNRALASADSLRRMLLLPGGTLERLEKDTAFLRTVRDTRAALDSTRQLLAAPSGTMGRMRSDSALQRELHDASSALGALGHDAQRNPSRYMPF